ncbi:MAG: Anthranilate phosphoribosyltransferase, partial [uncultured Sphingomonas sp.]
ARRRFRCPAAAGRRSARRSWAGAQSPAPAADRRGPDGGGCGASVRAAGAWAAGAGGDRGHADRAPDEGRDGGGDGRRGPGAVGGGPAVRAAGLSLRRLLRHGRGRVGGDQRVHRGGVRGGGVRAADRQARQSLGELALRVGRRAGSAGRAGGGRAGRGAAAAGRDGLLLPVRARLPPRDEACGPGAAAAGGAHGDEPARPMHQSGPPARSAAGRRRSQAAAADRAGAAGSGGGKGAGGTRIGVGRGGAARGDTGHPPGARLAVGSRAHAGGGGGRARAAEHGDGRRCGGKCRTAAAAARRRRDTAGAGHRRAERGRAADDGRARSELRRGRRHGARRPAGRARRSGARRLCGGQPWL